MPQDILQRYRSYVVRRRRRSVLKKVVSVLACTVIFCTTYALILPAITMEKETFCGIEEHIHNEKCYGSGSSQKLICTAEQLNMHTHSTSCFDSEGNLCCGQADYVIHSHAENCYDEENNLVCTIVERGAHVHTDSCYLPAETQPAVLHVHSERCNVSRMGQLLCTTEETEGHAHGDSCYVPGTELVCSIPENHVHGEGCFTYPMNCDLSTEPHVHNDSCRSRGELVCTAAEEDHAHNDSCYDILFTCGKNEGDAHVHGDGCYSTEPEQICNIPENHVHSEKCYDLELNCEIPETPGHVHGDECYEWVTEIGCGLEEGQEEPTEPAEPVLACTQPAAQVHIHGDGCFETVACEAMPICGNQEEGHEHTAECYELTCGKETHSHILSCYSNPEADLETAAQWEATFTDVELTGKWNEDVVAIAETQLGYAESSRNYAVWEDNTTHGYTRYGSWYGSPYGDWCAMFTSFCLHYAEVEGMPLHWGVRPWIEELTELKLYHEAEVYEPKAGDIIFYDWEGDDLSDHVGIVAEIIIPDEEEEEEEEEQSIQIKAIEGNSSNLVQYVYYDIDDDCILGYSELPDNLEVYSCGILRHSHNEYCYDEEENFICQQLEHQHTETCEPRDALYCGLEEHIHIETCYDEAGKLICQLQEHSHNEDCTVEQSDDQKPVYYCGAEEHTHMETCYDEAGELVCELTEHTHSEGCTIEPVTYYCGLEEHSHAEACYDEADELVCELTEHTHSEGCTIEPVTYYCGLEEHTHIETCYDETGELTCQLTEHTHSEKCAFEPVTYYCGLEEHTHAEACYDEVGELVCELTEHTHSEECTAEPIPTHYCGMEEHIHIETCYNEAGELICNLTEHTHSSLCTVIGGYVCGLEEHLHDEKCYDNEGNLTCTLPEHAHTDACKAQNIYACNMVEHTHSETCYDAAGNLICTLPEHIHTTACIGRSLYYSDPSIRVHAVIWGAENLPQKLSLVVFPVTPEENPEAFDSMQSAVSQELTGSTQYVDAASFYHMELRSEGALYELPETASVTVTMEFEQPIFAGDSPAEPLGTHAFLLTPEAGTAPVSLPKEPQTKVTEEPTEPSLVDSVISTITDAVSGLIPAAAAMEIEDEVPTDQAGENSYQLDPLTVENNNNQENGITSITFQTNRLTTFGMATTARAATGSYWLRIDGTSELTSGGTYMIVSAEGNYALSAGSSNNVPVTIEAVKGHERYYTISQDTTSSLRWTITKSGNQYSVKSGTRYLTASGNNVLTNSTSATVSFTSNHYSSADNGPYWRLSSLCNEGDQFKVNGSPTYADTRNMLIFKLTNEKITILDDVDGLPSGSGNGSSSAKDPQSYTDFTSPGTALTGKNKTAVTDTKGTEDKSDDISVTGSYYSDAPTSNLESQFRVKPSVLSNSGAPAAQIEAAATEAFNNHRVNDGKVLTDKSVIYGDDSYGAFKSYAPNTFGVTLSTLGQSYQIQELASVEIPVDVVFVLDVSGSMQDVVTDNKTRFELLVDAVNTSMYEILIANTENRVGIATYSSGSAVMLPLERYTADGNKYIDYYEKYSDSEKKYVPWGIKGGPNLKNSENKSYEGVGINSFDSVGTFTQAGIASGYSIFKAIGDDTTFTYTIGTGANAKNESAPRQPVFVLVTDGEPTHCTNVYNDPLNGPYYGDGQSAVKSGNNYKNGLGVMGYYTVLSANYFKRMIGIQYENPALFYTIGIGIKESGSYSPATTGAEKDGYKRAVLNPTSDNLEKVDVSYYEATTGLMKSLLEETFTSWQNKSDYITVLPINSHFGNGKWMESINADVPVLKDHPYDNKFAYADYAFFDSGTGLANIFKTILDNSLKTNPYRFILFDQKSYVDIKDNIGEGMEIKGLADGTAEAGSLDPLAPKLLYSDQFFTPTSISTTGDTTTITYSGTFVDKVIPGHKVNLSEITVSVKRDTNGLQTLTMHIPDTALPVYIPDKTGSFYYETLPVRLIYQVGLTAESEAKVLALRKNGGELTFYTNRYKEGSVAKSVLYPDVRNPYYFTSSTDASGNTVYKWQDIHHSTPKRENTTGTYGDVVTCSTEYQAPTVEHTHLLGNNGKLVFAVDTIDIPVEKVWQSVNTESVYVSLYKITPPATENGSISAELVETIILNSDGDWNGVFENKPVPTTDGSWYYAICETVPENFVASYNVETIDVGRTNPVKMAPVTVNGTTVNKVIITNSPSVMLPETGGIGTTAYTTTGFLLSALAAILLYHKKIRRGERSSF